MMSENMLQRATMLVTGGAGFIGSNFIRFALGSEGYAGRIINFDKLTYAGNLASLAEIDSNHGGSRYIFEKGDIGDFDTVAKILTRYEVSAIIHFAAESHVDRSIYGPKDFIDTNINGTFSLLEASRKVWEGRKDVRFHHVSTDEVFGSLGETGHFLETTPYDPRSPYSASKASSDHLVRAYYHTYGLPVTISNCSNNYGPYQFPEKLIPLMILNAMSGKSLPVYGDGMNVRDWLHVDDHCDGIWHVLRKGRPGETYNIGGECEKTNIEVVNRVCDIMEELYPCKDNHACNKGGSPVSSYKELIAYVKDRPGHDRRYAINCNKIKRELGWKARYDFDRGLRQTIAWYLDNPDWVRMVQTGEYRKWVDRNYGSREKGRGQKT